MLFKNYDMLYSVHLDILQTYPNVILQNNKQVVSRNTFM